MAKDRLAFFDVVKTIAIPLIVIQHIPQLADINTEHFVLPVFGNLGLGRIGVAMFVFTSGALLYHSYPRVGDLGKYFWRRALRLYPAYWLSIILGMIFLASRWPEQNTLKIIDQFLGLTMYTPISQNTLFNTVGWYIGMIMTLYLAYPLLARAFEKHAPITIIMVVFISIIYRAVTYGHPMPVLALEWYYSPISNIGFFVLGMATIKYGFYQKYNNIKYVGFLADLSFYMDRKIQGVLRGLELNWPDLSRFRPAAR